MKSKIRKGRLTIISIQIVRILINPSNYKRIQSIIGVLQRFLVKPSLGTLFWSVVIHFTIIGT